MHPPMATGHPNTRQRDLLKLPKFPRIQSLSGFHNIKYSPAPFFPRIFHLPHPCLLALNLEFPQSPFVPFPTPPYLPFPYLLVLNIVLHPLKVENATSPPFAAVPSTLRRSPPALFTRPLTPNHSISFWMRPAFPAGFSPPVPSPL